MSEHDEQLDGKLREELGRIEIPPADEAAKRRAINAAMVEFEAVQEQAPETAPKKFFQGLRDWLRLIVGTTSDERSKPMYANQRILISTLGAACVGVIAVAVTVQFQSVLQPTDPLLPGRTITSQADYDFAAEKDDVAATSVAPSPMEETIATGNREMLMEAEPRAEGKMRSDARKREQAAGFAAPALVASMPADVMPPVPGYQEHGGDRFEAFEQNPIKLVAEEPVSTFSVDVDTASYSFVRRQLNHGVLPQADAVRVEELINYFDYAYPQPDTREQPFEPTVALADSPWTDGRKLLHIGIKGYDLDPAEKPRSNLVFLLDVSGSMNSPDKLPLVKQSMELLLSSLDPDDTVAIAVYAGAAGTVLEPTPVKDKRKILDAMNQLSAGGSTAGAQGIRLAYELAEANFDKKALNRVILATDGDFNVGITSDRELQSFIERKRDAGIFLSVLGFGQGNYQDQLMQTLAQNGNGVAAYIDTLGEAQKLLVDEASSSLFPIAKDVKVQIEFNPETVAEYRLVGYETRHLNREDFNNDAVDAGDIGAGHTVTAIYEITPVDSDARAIDERRYGRTLETTDAASMSGEYAFLKLRYKLPDEDTSKLITRPVSRDSDAVSEKSMLLQREVDFATAVAGFAQLLKGGKHTGTLDYDDVIRLAQGAKGDDPYGYRTEFIQLVRKAKTAGAMQAR